jgi:hypothetical protein
MALVAMLGGAGAAWAKPTEAQKCEAAKNKAVGTKQSCLVKERAKEVLGRTPNFVKCSEAFTQAFAKAEAAAGPGGCVTEGDTETVEALIDACFDDITGALSGTPPAPCGQFPATGQTTCYSAAGGVIACPGTGQDGDIQAGATLSYTDNGDGTITDNNTGLMWEKQSDDGSIHDQDNPYIWADAFDHIDMLNATAFAGYTDWRLPNIKELLSILNYEVSDPAVSPAFDTDCTPGCTVLTCSCTPLT